MQFRAKKDTRVGLVFLFTAILCLSTAMLIYQFPRIIVFSELAGLFMLVISGLLGWIWVDTSYTVFNHAFLYRSGPFKGRILVSEINQVSLNRSLTVGKKPALSSRGMVITFRKYEEVFVAPVDPEGLIGELIRLNPAIKVFRL